MDCKQQTRLNRIATTLLGLARLADTAALRSPPVLHLVLWILRPVEWLARDLVVGLARDFGAPHRLRILGCSPIPPDHPDVRAAEALRLAAGFRLLAALVDHFAILAAGTGRPPDPARPRLSLTARARDETACALRLRHAHRRAFDAYVDTS